MAAQTSPPYIVTLPQFPPQGISYRPASIDPTSIITQWLAKLDAILSSTNVSALPAVFLPHCWWRDTLALSWDFRTIKDIEPLKTYLSENLPLSKLFNMRVRTEGTFRPSVKTPVEGVRWVESMFDFETGAGRGTGMVRLGQDGGGEWKGYMMYTSLQELKGFEEENGARRPHGGSNSLVGGAVTGNWRERRERQREFVDGDPTVLAIGAGQAGLSIGARLQQLGVSTLIVDKNERVGDNWRQRYRTLVLHDPIHYSHMACMPFPPNWPMFTPKDKIGDWFEAYASIMELNIWLSTSVSKAEYDDEMRLWTVKLIRADDKTRTLHPKHVIMATGQAGEAKKPTFQGQGKFKGQIYHASEHVDASALGDLKAKKVVVVGSGNSGHDIAQNYYENGAETTILQRKGTYVITAKKGLFMLHEGLYEEGGPPTEEADIYGQSMPIPVQFALNVHGTKRITAAETTTLDGLAKAGFEVDFGVDGSGIYRKYITAGGGYYIDVGCSQLIIDGKVKVKRSPGGIQEIVSDGLVLADGSKLEADILVLATGYDNMRTSVRKILGDKTADRCKDVWDLDEEGEVNAIWRCSGHPGFWYMGGSLALCRIYSKFLALQIKAIEEGLYSQPST